MRREKIFCRAFRREKNILPTRLLEKKILEDQKSPTPPPQELNRKHWHRKHRHALSHSLHFVGHEGESVLGLLQVRLIPHTLL